MHCSIDLVFYPCSLSIAPKVLAGILGALILFDFISINLILYNKEIKRCLLLRRSYDQPRQHIKKQRRYFANKGPSSQSYGFSSSRVWMWELNYKESWVPKNWCFWTVVPEKSLESPLDSKEIQPVHPKGNQTWIFIGRTDADTKTPILWPPDVKNWLIWKDPDAGKEWRQEKKRTTEKGWMALPAQWTWVWVSSGSCWWTGRPGVL